MNFARVAESTDRQLAIARRNLPAALVAAEESDRGLLGSAPMQERVSGGGGDGSSSVERAVLGRVGNRERRRLAAAASAVEAAAAEFASVVAGLSGRAPAARNCSKTGRVLVRCGNVLGCPTKSNATRDGLCEGCRYHRERVGGWRTLADIDAQRAERLRKDRERKQAARSIKALG